MRLIITIDMDNDAFGETRSDQAREMQDILRRYFETESCICATLRDSNGNTVGSAEVAE